MNESFIMFTEQWPAIALLSDAQRSVLLQAVFAHHGACPMPDMDTMTQAIFLMMRPRFDSNKAKYERKCETNRENGAKGGRPRKAENQSVTNKEGEQPENPSVMKCEDEKPKNPSVFDENPKTLLDPDPDLDPDVIPPREDLRSQDARVRSVGEGGGEVFESAGGDENTPGIEFQEIRQAYDAQGRKEAPLTGLAEYLTLKRSRQWPGQSAIFEAIERLATQDDSWHAGKAPGLAKFFREQWWRMQPRQRASPMTAPTVSASGSVTKKNEETARRVLAELQAGHA